MNRPPSQGSQAKPYPPAWENVADLRVLRTAAGDWPKLISWRAEMSKHGWKLLQVNSDERELVAVFGKTKAALRTAGV
jgi:hypothetical protein